MILVGTKNNLLYLKCDAGIAGDVLYDLSCIPDMKREIRKDCMVVSIPMKHIEHVNKILGNYKDHIKLHETFVEWKKNNIRKPQNQGFLYLKVGVIETRIYGIGGQKIPHKEIEDVCKYFFLPAVNMKKYKDKKWDGFIHLYKRWLKTFPTGLLDRVEGVLKECKINYKVEYMYEQKPPREFNWKARDWFTLSEDQEEAIKECMDAGRCVIKAATGFGKTSALARYLTAEHAVPTLFIANKKVLLDDAAKDFAEGIEGLGYEGVGQIKDGWFGNANLRSKKTTQEDIDSAFEGKQVIVATIQSLSTRLNDEKTRGPLLQWLHDKCKFLMVDETQAVGTKQWDEVLNEINAPYRVFLSATPKRSDGATLKIFAYAGPLVFDTTGSEQIAKGRLCELDIQYWPFNHGLYNENDAELVYNEVYTDSIVNNEERNKFVIERTLEMLDEERQVLVLIQFIEHGHILKEQFLEKGLEVDDVKFIWGDTPDKIRKETIANFRRGKGKVLIGSTIADVGLNIPSISGVILCGAGNSDITHIQRIGRGSRTFDYEGEWGFKPKFFKDAGDVKITKVIDILDDNIAFFKKQAKNRYYNACDEFGADRVHIVGADRSIFRHRSKKSKNLQKASEGQAEALKDMFSAFATVPETDKNQSAKISDKNEAMRKLFGAFKK